MMETVQRKFATGTLNSPLAQVPTVGNVQADLGSSNWLLSLHDPLGRHGLEPTRGRFSFEFKLEQKSHVLNYLLNQRCIDFIHEVRVRQDRQAEQLNGLGRPEVAHSTGGASKSESLRVVKELGDLISLNNIMEVAEMVQQQGERERSATKGFPASEEEVMMQAMTQRHRDMLDDLGAKLRDLHGGMDFLKRLFRSSDEQTARLALSLSERVGQLELQEDIRLLAVNGSLPDNLRQHAFALLVPELQWAVYEAGRTRRSRTRQSAEEAVHRYGLESNDSRADP